MWLDPIASKAGEIRQLRLRPPTTPRIIAHEELDIMIFCRSSVQVAPWPDCEVLSSSAVTHDNPQRFADLSRCSCPGILFAARATNYALRSDRLLRMRAALSPYCVSASMPKPRAEMTSASLQSIMQVLESAKLGLRWREWWDRWLRQRKLHRMNNDESESKRQWYSVRTWRPVERLKVM